MRTAWRTVLGVYNNGAIGYAKGAAYSALLAFFPVLATLTTILVRANAETVSHKVVEVLLGVAPAGTEVLVRHFIVARGAQPIGLPVAAGLLSLWAASGVMISLMEGYQATLGVPNKRGVVRQRLMAMWLVLIGILPCVAASAMMIFGERTETTILRWLGLLQLDQTLSGGIAVLGKALRYTVVLATVFLVTALFYYFGPAAPRKGRLILPGALLATSLWVSATLAFAWYVRNIANYNVLYGSIGAAIALLVWMYMLSLISLIGFECNAAVAER